MAIGLAALGLLAFLLGCSETFAEPQISESAAKCSLTGTWKCDLTNSMEIYSVSDTGVFSGLFHARRLPRQKDSIRFSPFPLLGIQNQGRQPTFAFTFGTDYPGLTFLFVGQCLVDENGKEQLRTTWLMCEDMESPEKDRLLTWFDRSTFHRTE